MFEVGGGYYLDTFCPFGHRSGSMASQRLIEMFRYLMAKRGYTVYGYVDDILGLSPKDTARTAYNYLLQLLAELNFPISEKNLVEPTTECNCLRLIANTVAHTISIPMSTICYQEKITVIHRFHHVCT